jgi:Xylanase inhibitor N-terminal/Xylanase inhibitor C-terminal
MASSSTKLPLTIVLILAFCRASLQKQVTAKNTGFSVNLIHRDSIKSPLHNPSHTRDDQIRAAIHRSISRAHYLQRVIVSRRSITPSSYDSNVTAGPFEYLMTLKVGTPSRSILAVADTGSDLVWTNCAPCNSCYKQSAPLFDPRSSSTYLDLSCDSNFCSAFESVCENNKCHYSAQYGDGSNSAGTLGQETFTFETSDGTTVDIDDIAFGCAHQSQGSFKPNMAGIVGLGGGPISLVSQLGSSVGNRFSYCLAPYSVTNTSSKINFGSSALFSDPNTQSTDLISGLSDTYYTINLSNIMIGDQLIEVELNDIIVDSGTTLNFLYSDTVDQIVGHLENIIPLPTVNDPDLQLCYNAGDVQMSNITFPDIVYTFGTATVTLGPRNYFVMVDGKVCLAMVSAGSSSGGEIQIVGNIAQQDFHVGYDLSKRKIYFAPGDCTKL